MLVVALSAFGVSGEGVERVYEKRWMERRNRLVLGWDCLWCFGLTWSYLMLLYMIVGLSGPAYSFKTRSGVSIFGSR